ncbi:MAG: GyrI-like domain-containing protein [Actinomycetota bacterium]|nr:GyrI-like domain-containing protein [Actinomycetota bacterium]
MEKIDYKKELKELYNSSVKEVSLVDVPKMNFLMIDGSGDPNTAKSFSEALEALFSLSYAIKFMIKKGKEALDFAVMPLEALWWADDVMKFAAGKKDDWYWTVMVMQPGFVTEAQVKEAMGEVKKKKELPALELVRFESFTEGKAAQIMHIGPFSEEGPTIERVHRFIKDNGFKLSGKHHEIYLSDTRRTAPEKWKTIIRQPFEM